MSELRIKNRSESDLRSCNSGNLSSYKESPEKINLRLQIFFWAFFVTA